MDNTYAARIQAAKEALGPRCVVLGHNYQRDEVIVHADKRGDSLKLALLAAEEPTAEFLVFCGVHFMAETADILSRPAVQVILPDMAAGCSMADMASSEQVDQCWETLQRWYPDTERVVAPLVYVNSTAALKAFCGEHGGATCTSSNAKAMLQWAWRTREKILFFPDEHLGRNVANAMGLRREDMVVWDPMQPRGGVSKVQLDRAKLILWKGFCSVHQMFQPAHVDLFRKRYPDMQVIVHPECHEDVVAKADFVGSTEYIIQTVSQAPTGTVWGVGTEWNLVNRLKHEQTNKQIFFLAPSVCQCATMYRIDAAHLCWALESLVQGTVVNPIVVPADDKVLAKRALEVMLRLK